jgi:hypothetical protein
MTDEDATRASSAEAGASCQCSSDPSARLAWRAHVPSHVSETLQQVTETRARLLLSR